MLAIFRLSVAQVYQALTSINFIYISNWCFQIHPEAARDIFYKTLVTSLNTFHLSHVPTEMEQFSNPYFVLKLFPCVSGMIGFSQEGTRCYHENVGFSWSRIFSGFHGYQGILCRGAELSVSITKRLISIKVLVQEEVLEPFRSTGSCAAEEQSKRVIAVIL